MFKNTFQSGFLSILYSIGSKPLQIWDKKVRNGHIKRITDNDIQSLVLEILGSNVSTTYITCPADPRKTLGIKLPFLVMIIKNLKKYFTFEVQVSSYCIDQFVENLFLNFNFSQYKNNIYVLQIIDDKNVRRRFRASNYQSTTRVKPFICTMPMRLDDGWNQIQFNLADFTRRAYGTNYVETLRVQIHANCRIRRVYFSDRLYSEDELPAEFKLFLPIQNKAKCQDIVKKYVLSIKGKYCLLFQTYLNLLQNKTFHILMIVFINRLSSIYILFLCSKNLLIIFTIHYSRLYPLIQLHLFLLFFLLITIVKNTR